MMNCYLGVDVGSVSTNIVLTGENGEVMRKLYLRTAGRPIETIREGLKKLYDGIKDLNFCITGVGTTGSGRQLAGVMLGADLIKNEISAHGIAARQYLKDVHTVIEIGGQDSKIILFKDGVISDFAMNTVCAAGTGSFLDRQAERLGIPIGKFGELARKSASPVAIAGRCAVFAESDMIHKQQNGHRQEDIIAGLCEALVRNYLNNLAKGKQLQPPVLFQGGVAANVGMVDAFERALNAHIYVPEHYDVMGAWGVALLVRADRQRKKAGSNFCGFNAMEKDYMTESVQCSGCSNQCEIIQFRDNDAVLARWGGRCGKWNGKIQQESHIGM